MHLPTEVENWLWPAFIFAVVILILIDLVIHKISQNKDGLKFKSALIQSVFWISLAILFNIWFYFRYGPNLGLQFASGYLVELSLSVDNLFVMILIFKAFRIHKRNQHGVLFWGILGAIVLRGLLILVGVDLIHKFNWVFYVFGVILLSSAIKFLFSSDEVGDVTESWFVQMLRKTLPISQKSDSDHFFIKEDGRLKLTPLFIALIVIEFTDLVFAVDSIPAVLALTRDAFVAFGSNILALMGLRSLYFILSEMLNTFRYLKPGLAAILAFVGFKMLVADLFTISESVSLLVILFILLTAGLTSWYANRKK